MEMHMDMCWPVAPDLEDNLYTLKWSHVVCLILVFDILGQEMMPRLANDELHVGKTVSLWFSLLTMK
jgi:hypothetical protein